MAESKKTKKQKTPDDFADDLNSMLNLDEATEQQVGLIDDDDAIDRLLMDDAFGEVDGDSESAELNSFDNMIAVEMEKNDKFAADFDEFGVDADDFLPDIQTRPVAEDVIDSSKTVLFSETDDKKSIAPFELETAGEIDEFGDEMVIMPASISESEMNITGHDELEHMTEIDEFSDHSEPSGRDDADFLLADFDISPDDEEMQAAHQPVPAQTQALVEPEAKQTASYDEFADDEPALEHAELATSVSVDEQTLKTEAIAAEPVEALESNRIAELTAGLAEITTQLNQLSKQQLQLKQQFQHKNDQDALPDKTEDIDALKTELKKTRRELDAIVNKKPVSAYVANALAVLALMLGSGLAIQTYIAKVQLGQLVELFGQLQQQVNTGPVADVAEQERLRKRLDELALANTTTANQIAELNKAIQGGTSGADGTLSQQLEQLNKQDMQIGAAIESLQGKVSALEKGKTVAAAPPVAKKKPAIVQENWVVNLVAFKQDWYAKRKAEEFAAKGVSAKVSRAETKGEIWYRLVVDGFKSQYEAAAYAARVKKTLNLDSVWVAKANH